MDCRESQALLSAIHDGDPVPADKRTQAKRHCKTCGECAAFVAALARLDAFSPAAPPAELPDIIMDAVREAAKPQPEPEPPMEAPARATSPLSRRIRWTPATAWLVGTSVTAAAAVLVAVSIGVLGSRSPVRPIVDGSANLQQLNAPRELSTGAATGTSGGSASPGAHQSTTGATAVSVPNYIAFQDYVYLAGSMLAPGSAATPVIGETSSSFDVKGGAATQATVYRSPLTDGSIVLARGGASKQLFTPVTRTYNGQTFQLVAGVAIPSYGTWPQLPPRFTEPTASNGAPAFIQAGADASGVALYIPSGADIMQGFAVAPGTASTDPAAGDPHWTWWAPLTTP